jgi:hypothetical protein
MYVAHQFLVCGCPGDLYRGLFSLSHPYLQVFEPLVLSFPLTSRLSARFTLQFTLSLSAKQGHSILSSSECVSCPDPEGVFQKGVPGVFKLFGYV